MKELIALIFVGSIAFRGAATIASNIGRGDFLSVPFFFGEPAGRKLVEFYVLAALPVAFLNGFLLHFSWQESVVVGVGTWIGMLFATFFLRFNPIGQFWFFGIANLVWLVSLGCRTLFA